jgi:hypothetical protein
MKKTVILLLVLISNFSFIYADSLPLFNETNYIPNTESVEEISIWMGQSSTDINTIDLDYIKNSSYIYYYWDWCSHCTKVDDYLRKTDGYNKLDIIKKEVWSNNENSVEMSEVMTRLWLNPLEVWIPFILVTNWENESYLSWDTTIIEYFKPYLWEIQETNKKLIFIIILAIAGSASAFLVIINNKRK